VGLALDLELPETVPARVLASDVRNSVLMAVKEALNNIAKHAGATKVGLNMMVEGALFGLQLATTAGGLIPEWSLVLANGLRNMIQRMVSLKGSATVSSTPGKGTEICFVVILDS